MKHLRGHQLTHKLLRHLIIEATFIIHNFSQQVLKTGEKALKYKDDDPYPFMTEGEGGKLASVACRYRKWDLGGSSVLLVRSEHEAVLISAKSYTLSSTIVALKNETQRLPIEWSDIRS